jgi:hypothetical protein
MRDADIGDVIVIENNQICGMVTDRDIVVCAVAEAWDPATTTLADICSHALTTVSPTDSIEQAVGIVSLGDLAVERDPSSALGDISSAPPNTSPEGRMVPGSRAGGTPGSGRNGGAYGGNAGRDQGRRTTSCAGAGAE